MPRDPHRQTSGRRTSSACLDPDERVTTGHDLDRILLAGREFLRGLESLLIGELEVRDLEDHNDALRVREEDASVPVIGHEDRDSAMAEVAGAGSRQATAAAAGEQHGAE